LTSQNSQNITARREQFLMSNHQTSPLVYTTGMMHATSHWARSLLAAVCTLSVLSN